MKKVLFSLVFLAMSMMTMAQQWVGIKGNTPAAPQVKLVSSSEQQVVVDFSLSGFTMTRVSTPNGIQQVISVPKMATMLEAGAPDLPQFPVPAIIGNMAEMEVSVIKSAFIDYENVEVAPSKGNFSRQIDPESVPYTYGEMYSQNAFYPAAQAHLEMPYIIRDFRGQNIMVTPFSYNPVTKTLRVYHQLTLAMNKVSDNGVNQKVATKSIHKVSPEMKATYSRRFINYKENDAKYNFLEDRGELLIICADQFMAGMEEFIAWKNQSGRPTTMVSVSEAGGNNDTQIKNYINSIYSNPERNLVFVLFVGDYEHITPHSVSGERSDNWFGQLEGNDRYDEVMIGRFSAQTDTHLANQVNKVLYYERDMPEDLTWVNKGLGIGAIGAGSGHYGEDDYQHIDFIRDTLEHYTYEHVTELHGGGGGASQNSISNAINEGVSIINYCNHGSETSWGVANYSNSNVNALVNDYMWPINWSVACLTGRFNYGGANGECFAEAWMRASNNSTGVPTGAIGGMFSWMSQPWIPPMYGQDEMVDILCEWRSADKFSHTFGAASVNGNMKVLDMSGSQGNDTHDTWILFGDPSLMVRTDNPVSMNINCTPAVLMLGMSELEITAENTAFGIATLMMDNEVVASGYIDNGTCTLSFSPMSNVGTATLTVIGYNKVTEVMPIEVLPAEGPYVTVANYTPNFAPVNLETSLTMSFKNVGVDPTDGNTTVTLTCEDERLSILNETAQFGVLAAEETIVLQDAFSFIVAEGVEDGTRFKIDVQMTDGRQTWNGKIIITAGQAILEYAGTDWAGGFVPGETVTFVAKFKNVGHYMATNAIASIACESEYVTLLNPTLEIGTIDPEGISTCVFNVLIDAACPETEQIPVNFMMQADGELTAEGSITLKNACNVVFELTDSYGDGWNGANLSVSFDDGTPSQNLTMTSGESATYTIEIGNGVHVTLNWSSGQWDTECSFIVRYEDGDVIYNCSSVHSGLLYEFDCNCAGGQPIGIFNPIENLVAEVGIGTNTLTWDEPEGAINYIISRNGIEIAQTSEPTYVDEVFNEFFYTYCVVAEYTDGLSAPECIVVKSELGVDETETEFAIYPNPVNNILYINGGNAEYSYEMYNGMGQMMAKGNAKGTEQISVDGMTKGVYFLRLTSGAQVHMEKVVVK
ncbi:MAG: T9SS type A sorting domain-containing protein [Bacteroidales bacterium]|nr:T9SS type A sorting domain-containing protein [Bacteroidales bacterium]